MKPGLIWDADEVEKFYRFVCERHSIWHRRFVEHRPWPWTQDPVLRRHKFTNIYRELDPGTKFLMDNILETYTPRPDRIFNVMLYRLMCSIPTYRGMGFQYLSAFNEKEFDEYLRGVYNSGKPVFGNAYLISPYSSMGSEFKFRNVSRLFGLIHQNFEGFFFHLDHAVTFEMAFKMINGQYGFGPFLAYQVMVDLTYPVKQDGSPILPLSQDDWARLGPGALRGLARMTTFSGTSQSLEGLRWLWSHQHEQFAEYDLSFPYLRDTDDRETAISLANMQNCLCEFHKYRSIQDGVGKAQRLYVPSRSMENV